MDIHGNSVRMGRTPGATRRVEILDRTHGHGRNGEAESVIVLYGH